MNQDYEALIQEAMVYQPVINIGMIGHVSNGKSTITKSLTQIATQKHSAEKQKNITIKLGYANAKIYKCNKCSEPDCYQSGPSHLFSKNCKICNNEMTLITHISIVDCPGHIRFMSTMLNGTNVMDTTILVEAMNNEVIPAPQTVEHINAITLGKIPNSVICLNKFDLVKKDHISKKIEQLKTGLANTAASNSPMVPISATFDINVDVLCHYISQIRIPKRNLEKPVKMIIIRSFNVNKPGINIDNLCGGVVGGSILEGKIHVGQQVELRPGYCVLNDDPNANKKNGNRWKCKPLQAQIVSINSENNRLESAIPGGLIGVQLDLDAALTANDGLIGQVLTPTTCGADIYEDLAVSYELLDKNSDIKKGDVLQLNINACNISCEIQKIFKDENILKLSLEKPVSVNIEDKVTICHNGRIFGTGHVVEGRKAIIL